MMREKLVRQVSPLCEAPEQVGVQLDIGPTIGEGEVGRASERAKEMLSDVDIVARSQFFHLFVGLVALGSPAWTGAWGALSNVAPDLQLDFATLRRRRDLLNLTSAFWSQKFRSQACVAQGG